MNGLNDMKKSGNVCGSFMYNSLCTTHWSIVHVQELSPKVRLQALVYDILPSTAVLLTAVFSYAIGSRKLSANKQFFVGAQTVVSLLQLKLYQTFVL